MKEKMKYEKPSMNRVELGCDKDVANVCWGGATDGKGQDLTWYFDSSGKGYLSFIVRTGNCSKATNDNVEFTYHNFDSKTAVTDEANAVAEFFTKVNVANAGSPWEGEGTITPTTPSGMS